MADGNEHAGQDFESDYAGRVQCRPGDRIVFKRGSAVGLHAAVILVIALPEKKDNPEPGDFAGSPAAAVPALPQPDDHCPRTATQPGKGWGTPKVCIPCHPGTIHLEDDRTPGARNGLIWSDRNHADSVIC